MNRSLWRLWIAVVAWTLAVYSGGCVTAPPPELVISQTDHHLYSHEPYWSPSAEDIAKAKRALQVAWAADFIPGIAARITEFRNCALTFLPDYVDGRKVIRIIVWGGWRESGGPLLPNSMSLGGSGNAISLRCVYVPDEDRVMHHLTPASLQGKR